MRKIGKYLLILFLTVPPAAEIAARIIGWTPLRNDDFHVDSSPSPWIRGNDDLGFELVPGSFDIVLNHTLHFKSRHLPDGSRAVGANEEIDRKIMFAGCSYTYGYGVDDAQTFVSLLQDDHPDWHFRNAAVPGYCTAQALLLLEKAIEEGEQPEIFVLVHSKVHEARDIFANSWRKALKIGFMRSNEDVNKWMQGGRFPHYDLKRDIILETEWDAVYTNWPGRETFAIVNALQSSSETEIPEAQQKRASKKLIQKIEALCQQHGIQCVVLDLDGSALAASDLSATTVFGELNFDFSRKDLLNQPVDRHPNAKGHVLLHARIQPILNPLLHE